MSDALTILDKLGGLANVGELALLVWAAYKFEALDRRIFAIELHLWPGWAREKARRRRR